MWKVFVFISCESSVVQAYQNFQNLQTHCPCRTLYSATARCSCLQGRLNARAQRDSVDKTRLRINRLDVPVR